VPQDVNKQLDTAISILKGGGLVAFPTDTVYGLGALASNVEAIKRIYEVKQRPLSQAMPLLISDYTEAEGVVVHISDIARLLMQKFWPGALTLVFKKAAWLPAIVTAGGDTVALRVPNHKVAIALIKGVGMPLVGTSANRSGQNSPITAGEVKTQLGDKIDLIIDGGTSSLSIESTIVDVTFEPPRILREVPFRGLKSKNTSVLLEV
jgi:L-threonylcarbamoyladenylate synthase